MAHVPDKKIIGQAEKVSFPDLGDEVVYARIDTGAQTSAVWASSITVSNDRLEVIFYGPEHPAFTGKVVYFDEFSHVKVISSNGQSELRYKIPLRICIGGKVIRSRVTLTDRSKQVFPVLIGRNTLRGKFIVDVKLGKALIEEEKERSAERQSKLEKES